MNAAAEEESNDDPNDLHTPYTVIQTHKRAYLLAHLENTKDDTYHSSSNGQSQQGTSVHTGTTLRTLGLI